ncbi:Putative phosphoenolpyruvate synthase regulatory protein [Frankliniella fusca]|uniref:Phosphoenolpyruvate synthase regulatory protein n=1 Tax=Frankliniella fusca TaxID=407009 RepID=A0AAE1HRD0_9NEOP|nr:Putative phosphoenolpyruvate synthase regulatory protein [Frankliniella fusca]
MKCTICNGESHKFFQIPLADQIRNLFENHGLADLIDKYNADRSNLDLSNSYADLLDGSEFKRAHVDGQYNLDLMGHTDGISVSVSSNVSLWPLEWVIAQLPPTLRLNYVLVNGVWLDESKPYMNTMMKPFTRELEDLRENGVQWTRTLEHKVRTQLT